MLTPEVETLLNLHVIAVMTSCSQMTTENVPVSSTEDSQSESALISPSTKKSFFKKNIEDGMDK